MVGKSKQGNTQMTISTGTYTNRKTGKQVIVTEVQATGVTYYTTKDGKWSHGPVRWMLNAKFLAAYEVAK